MIVSSVFMNMFNINEIFYSLQGEGFWTGRPAVFVRFSGCNLKCPFCDTNHHVLRSYNMDDLVSEIIKYKSDFVVMTGGEPSLFINKELVDALHYHHKYVAVETNGTHSLPDNVDWITLSPKNAFVGNADVVLEGVDEVKVVFTHQSVEYLPKYENFNAKYFFLQPCDMGGEKKNEEMLQETIDYCLDHPQWSLSLQTHKIIGVR